MAISARILVEIILMAVLGPVEVLERLHLHGQRRLEFSGNPVADVLDRWKVLGVRVIDAGAVTGADVLPLLVDAGGVNGPEVDLENPLQPDIVGVIGHVHRLGVACGVRADLAVCRVEDVAVGISRLGGDHSVNLFEIALSAPETACGKIDVLFHSEKFIWNRLSPGISRCR